MRRTYRPWSHVEEVRLRDLTDSDHTIAQIAQLMGRSAGSIQNKQGDLGIGRVRTLRQEAPPPTAPDAPEPEQPPTLESEPSPEPVTLEEFLAARQVDLDVWEVERHLFNEWGDPGAPNHQLKVWLRRKPGAALEALWAQILADIRAENATLPRIRHKPPAVPSSERCALELDIFDLHIGKLAHAEEVGHNFDSRIAAECAEAAVRDLLWQASVYPIEQIVLPLGNDFFNVDNLRKSTSNDTPQDTDTRYHLMFRRGTALARWMIRECAAVAPVAVVIVPGNHDRQTMFDLGELLAVAFEHDPRVTVNNSAFPRKYHVYGQNLIGFCHGDEEKPAELPEIMATDEPVLWGQCPYREFHIGHFHHGKEKAPLIVDDKRSVTVRWIRSLSGSDRWHVGKGYLGRRGAEAFVYRKTGGLRAHLFTYPDVSADAA